MILLDTNVLSELMRVKASPSVIDWLDQQLATDLHISAITRGEIELGIGLLSGGKKKQRLVQAALKMFDEFTGRCLPFEETAAIEYGQLASQSRKFGRPMSVEDAQISAIALTHGMSLATRNTKDFSSIDSLKLINPWTQ